MLEAKNDNKDRNDIDIKDNTSGTVGFDPKTGRVYYINEPKKEVNMEDLSENQLDSLIAEIEQNTAEMNKLIEAAKSGDYSALED